MKFLLSALILLFTLQGYSQKNAEPKVTFVFLNNNTEGSISGVKVDMDVNWNELSKTAIVGVAQVKNLTTGNNKRDNHLKSEDFFNVSEFPMIKFVCRSMEKNGSGYLAKGKLTIKGVTKPIDLVVKTVKNTLVWTSTIDTADFGIKVKKGEGKNKVEIRVEVPNSNL